MDIIGLIKNALQVLISFMELKNKAFYYDIMEKSRKHQQDLIDEIEKLRNAGTNNSNDLADVVRAKLIAEKQYAEHLSAKYSVIGKE